MDEVSAFFRRLMDVQQTRISKSSNNRRDRSPMSDHRNNHRSSYREGNRYREKDRFSPERDRSSYRDQEYRDREYRDRDYREDRDNYAPDERRRRY
jgi:hypothetical protein